MRGRECGWKGPSTQFRHDWLTAFLCQLIWLFSLVSVKTSQKKGQIKLYVVVEYFGIDHFSIKYYNNNQYTAYTISINSGLFRILLLVSKLQAAEVAMCTANANLVNYRTSLGSSFAFEANCSSKTLQYSQSELDKLYTNDSCQLT